ncbi:MAG: 16S rRNA (uracil(1498)-N(3))-methyltransferase [Candidatus Berkiellales bacterium]
MFTPRIYYPHPLVENNVLSLDKTACHYLTTVLRLTDNDEIILFNGQGGEYLAKIKMFKKNVEVHVLSFRNKDLRSPVPMHLGQSLVRGDRMDAVIQKATELGVNTITPLISANCQVKLVEARSQKRLQHWQNIAISACEQCGRTELPIIHPPTLLNDWTNQSFLGISLLLEPESQTALKNISPPSAIRLAIGPESGWQKEEVTSLVSQHFVACHLGPRILRTETASLVALSILQAQFGDLS